MTNLCTLTELKLRLGSPDNDDDAMMDNILGAVTAAFTSLTGRRFYATTETRYYTAEHSDVLRVDDLLTVTTLKTDDTGDRTYSTTWATTDYDLEPDNAAADGRPYDRILTAPEGRYLFPAWRRGVQIAGSFGYAATTPDDIHEAALLACEQMYKRKDSPLGMMGSSGFYQSVKAQLDGDPQIGPILRMYRSLT